MKKSYNFKGFNDWVEIFRGGRQVDSAGREHDGDALIDQAVASFHAEEHEPPLVIGHPTDNAPAYGYVKALKAELKNGVKVLFARCGEVVPEFEEIVKAGLYKKRSSSFYPDGRLRHVGFLGAVPPAVKGLADLKFAEGEPVNFEFADYNLSVMARLFSSIREFFIAEKGIETADRIIPVWDIDHLKEIANQPEEAASVSYSEPQGKEKKLADVPKQFSEADLEAAKKKAAEEARAQAASEFAESEGKRKIAEFSDRMWPRSGEPKLPPALRDAGVRQFMAGLDHQAVIEFGEGQPKQTPLAWFMNFLEGLPKVIPAGEIAGRDTADLPDLDNAQEIAKRAQEFVESEKAAGRIINVTEAVAHVTQK